MEHPHQQCPIHDLRLRRATVSRGAIEQGPDTADFGGRWVVTSKMQHAVGVRRFPVHIRLKAAVVAPPHEHVKVSTGAAIPSPTCEKAEL